MKYDKDDVKIIFFRSLSSPFQKKIRSEENNRAFCKFIFFLETKSNPTITKTTTEISMI